MADPANGDADASRLDDAVATRMARLIGLEIPAACVPGVVTGLEALEAHLRVLRSAEPDR